MTRAVIERSELGDRTKIAEGGQGIVYRVQESKKTKFTDSLVYKEYKAQVLADIDFRALAAMPELVENSLSYDDGERLISMAAWPCAMVENAGKPTGFVMPAIPDDFYISLTTLKGVSRNPAEFQHLLNPESVLNARGIALDDVQRYALLREVASALAFFHAHGVCVGDISPKNLLFSLRPREAIYFIDCDAMRIHDVSALTQVETPGWGVPAGEEPATVYSDTYKLGLLALRLLVGDQDVKNPRRLPPITPTLLRGLITDTLNREPARRPLPATWIYILGQAIEEAQHRKKTARTAPAPIRTATTASPPPAPYPQPHPAQLDDAGLSAAQKWLLGGVAAVFAVIVLSVVATIGGSHDSGSTATSYSPTYQTTAGGSTSSPSPVPAPGLTSTAEPAPPAVLPQSQTSQPYWDGPWLRNYWEGNQDCNEGRYGVVQPGDTADMYALRIGCFPQARINDLNSHCQSFSLPPGKCAVWDPNNIMSTFNTHGDLLVVALTQACLDRAGLTEFHEGPLHRDCVVSA
ncbi:hypothetical protein ACRU13_19085 [Mycobacterium colombiense]